MKKISITKMLKDDFNEVGINEFHDKGINYINNFVTYRNL